MLFSPRPTPLFLWTPAPPTFFGTISINYPFLQLQPLSCGFLLISIHIILSYLNTPVTAYTIITIYHYSIYFTYAYYPIIILPHKIGCIFISIIFNRKQIQRDYKICPRTQLMDKVDFIPRQFDSTAFSILWIPCWSVFIVYCFSRFSVALSCLLMTYFLTPTFIMVSLKLAEKLQE